jgi:hypothetical protein
MLDRDPNARVMGQPSDIALVVLEIWTDHKPGPDGTLIAVDKVKFGKKGAENYERIDEIPRLKRQEPEIYEWFEKNIYLGWQKHHKVEREGLPLEAWPAITKGQITACKDLGLHVVEDIATATSTIQQKLGMGATELIKNAKAFLANKDQSANAAKITELEAAVAALTEALEEERAARKAKAGRKAKETDE